MREILSERYVSDGNKVLMKAYFRLSIGHKALTRTHLRLSF